MRMFARSFLSAAIIGIAAMALAATSVAAEDKPGLYEIGIKFVGILPPEFKSLMSQLAPTGTSG